VIIHVATVTIAKNVETSPDAVKPDDPNIGERETTPGRSS